MKIGILGTGRMGSELGRLWAGKGHDIFFGSRTPEKAQALAQTIGLNTRGGSLAEAAAFGDVLLLASIWVGVEETLQAAGPLAGKILIDCTLPLKDREIAVNHQITSAAEEIAKLAPGSKVVKAFNTISYEHLENPRFGSETMSLFYCGNDADAKVLVAQLGAELGLDTVDSGPLFIARLLEAMGVLWIFLAVGVGHGGNIAFKLLRRA